MDAVHGFRDIILEGDSKFDLLNYLTIVRNLLVHQESPHLVGRALWTLSTYSKSDLYNPQMLVEILDVTLCSLSPEKSHILRISAVRTLHGFLQANETSEGRSALCWFPSCRDFWTGSWPWCLVARPLFWRCSWKL